MSAGVSRPIVLVADDDAGIRMLCRVNLEFEGYTVLEAQSAAEVERELEAADVALVLLDVHLGRDNGIELARAIRERDPDVRICFFTGSAQVPLGEREGVADGLIPKPFTLEELSETVARLAREPQAPRA